MPANLENSAVATGLEKVSVHFNSKEGQCQRMSKLLVKLYSLLMLSRLCSKSFRLSFRQYMNRELPDVQAGFRKEGTRDQIANICCIIEKAREFQKASTSASEGFDYSNTFDCVDHNKLWKILKEMRITDHLTCLLRNLNVG